MANEEHLAILRHGIEVWNRWREENPYIHPDLEMADLEYADLREVWTPAPDVPMILITDV